MGVTRLGYRGVIGRFYQRLDALVANSWAPLIAMPVQTDQASEEYRWLGMSPAVREWIGGRRPVGLRESGITITNKTFEATLDLNVDEMRRDKSGQIQARIDDLAGRVAEHWHKLLSTLIVTPGNSYDGTTFYSATHSEGESGTLLNLLTNTQVPALNVTTPAAPTVDEAKSIIMGLIAYMQAYKDDKGEPMTAEAQEFAFMVSPNLYPAFWQACTLPLIAAAGSAVPNPLPSWPGLKLRVISNPRLATTDVVYTFITDRPVKPFIMQEELFEVGDEDDKFFNNRYLVGVKLIRNVGTAFWQYASKATLS